MERTSRNNYWSCQHRGLQARLEGPGQEWIIHWAFEHFSFLYHQHKLTALFFSAHSTSTAHICWRWAVLPFADQTFRFRFKTYIVFSRQNLFFTCIALRWLNSWLFLETSGSFSNFNQPHKWSGILKCFSLQKGVFSFRINELEHGVASPSLPPLLTIRHMCTRRLDFHTLIG